VTGGIMIQEINIENLRVDADKNAILERLKYPNLTLGDLLATKAFATIAQCDPDIIDNIMNAIGNLKNQKMPKGPI